MYDLLIIGGGPGGVSAGVYASRKQLKTVLVTEEWGGQSVVSAEIQNWIGTIAIPGAELAKSFENHLRAYAGDIVTIKDGLRVASVEKSEEGFTATLSNGEAVTAKAVLITTGSARRKLEVPGAAELDHKGLTYCATCDGPLFAGQDVVVVGGGNAAFETAAQLLAYAKSVALMNRSADFRADPVTVEKVKAHPNMTIITNAIPTAVLGEKFVSGMKYKDAVSGEEKELKVGGIFVEIGLLPNTSFVGDLVKMDAYNRIEIDPWTQQTSTPGVWAAGDCTIIKYHQNNISSGDAVKALEDIYVHLKTK
jgi:alkyl hydroperoxide reductase subunit F